MTLALAPGLLVGAGAKIIGSKSVDQSAFAESTETLGNPTSPVRRTSSTEKKSALMKTTEEKKSVARRRRHRRRRSSIRTTGREGIRKTATSASKTKAE